MKENERTIISEPSQATPRWLTRGLREAKVLKRGEVLAIRDELVLKYNSTIHRLHLIYSADANEAAPATLILKIKTGDGARDEMEIARRLAPHRKHLPMLVDWYDAAYSEELKLGHFLMRDLSRTHVQPVNVGDAIQGKGVPSEPQLDQIVDCIAEFHAYWWEHPGLGGEIGAVHGGYGSVDEFERQIVSSREREYRQFLEKEGAGISLETKRMFDQALPRLGVLYERHIQPRIAQRINVTLIHGDCYFGQFFCPRDSVVDRSYLIDLESANTFLAAMDLAFLFATFWTRQQRRENDRERRCLNRYYERLCAAGVSGFDFDQLISDYKTVIGLMIFYPIWDCVIGRSREAYWRPKLQCLTDAYCDWQCERLTE